MTHDDAHAPDDLQLLRDGIDEIDEEFVRILAERFRLTRRVGQIKRDRGLPAIDETRERQISEKARRLAVLHDLEPDLVDRVLRTIIDRVVQEHRDPALHEGRAGS